MSSDEDDMLSSALASQRPDYDAAGLPLIELQRRHWQVQRPGQSEWLSCKILKVRPGASFKQAVVKFKDGDIKQVPLRSLKRAVKPSSPDTNPFEQESNQPPPKRAPRSEQWLSSQVAACATEAEPVPPAQPQPSTSVDPAERQTKSWMRPVSKRNPRQAAAQRQAYLMRRCSQSDHIYTPPVVKPLDETPAMPNVPKQRAKARKSTSSSSSTRRATPSSQRMDVFDDDVDNTQPHGLVRKVSKRRRQQVHRSAPSSSKTSPSSNNADKSQTDLPSEAASDSDDDRPTADANNADKSNTSTQISPQLPHCLSATTKLKRAARQVRPQFDSGVPLAEAEALMLWEGQQEESKVDFSVGRGAVGGLASQVWPWNHLRHVPVVVPASINRYLRSYQREGVCVMAHSLYNGQGHLLADDMGLGKTVQVIALLAALFGKTGYSDTDAGKSSLAQFHRGTVLIVCPSSVLYNWASELETWGFFEVGTYHGSHREQTYEALLDNELDVVLTTYGTLKTKVELQDYDWTLVVLDECHRIRNDSSATSKVCQPFKTLHRIGLSGTIFQNNFKEMWTVLNWARPRCLGSYEEFDARIEKPIVQGHKANASETDIQLGLAASQKLMSEVTPMMLRRTKAELADQLPNKSEHVYFCKLTPYQMECYRRYLTCHDVDIVRRRNLPCDCGSGVQRKKCCFKFIKAHKKGYCNCDETPGGIEKCRACHCSQEVIEDEDAIGCAPWSYLVFPIMSTLRQLSNHPAMLIPSNMDDPKTRDRRLKQCRDVFDPNDPWFQEIGRNRYGACADLSRCGKMLTAKRLVARWLKQGDAIIIFSYSTRLLNLVQDMLQRDGKELLRIDGSVTPRKRQHIVEEFNKGGFKLILVSTKAGGEGINLTAANRVLILDPCFNPSHDRQAQDRAYRIGQQRDVEVVRLVTLGSMEELVYARQVYKMQLASIAMEGRTDHKRLFEAAKDIENGELFGLDNIMAEPEERSLIQVVLEREKDLSAADRTALEAVAGKETPDGFLATDYRQTTDAAAASALSMAEQTSGFEASDVADEDGDVAHEVEVNGLLQGEGEEALELGSQAKPKRQAKAGSASLSLEQVLCIPMSMMLGNDAPNTVDQVSIATKTADRPYANVIDQALTIPASTASSSVSSQHRSAGKEEASSTWQAIATVERFKLLKIWHRWLSRVQLPPSASSFRAFVAYVASSQLDVVETLVG
eukprot:TRINITY_DN11592_c0_g1_i2.p1 TRINITY_DN11592_c0_g1~~TRINITY_DN11592_c0_g1_i2.p1  ORF type:complete len:1209 (+),score=314.27 TRINITY_DN11592_c0_g1_i2:105-3731(+)